MESKEKKVVGFSNIGAQCWFNSMLQALISCDYIVDAVKKESKECSDAATLNTVFLTFDNQKIFRTFTDERKDFASGQQDASEGLIAFIACLKNKEVEFVLCSRYTQTLKCKCGMVSEKKDENFIRVIENVDISTDEKLSKHLLNSVETVDYKCTECKGTKMIKYMTMCMVGDVLVLLVKNYMKSTTSITQTLTLSENKFELVAVVNHHSAAATTLKHGIDSGHFTANVKRGKKWYSANDSTITEIANPITSFAYILFYQRV